MRKEDIISKGNYTYPQLEDLVSVKQYIMLREKGVKQLLLRLSNDKREKLGGISFRLDQYDVKGKLIKNDVFTSDGIDVKPTASFGLNLKVELEEECVDFKVEMIWARYGDYLHQVRGNDCLVTYDKQETVESVDTDALSKKMLGKKHEVITRTVKPHKLMLAAVVVMLAAVMTFVGIRIADFMRTEECFTLDSVEYRFTTDDHISGPISVLGYKGNAGNVIIPESIEGHKVESIADEAFMNASLNSIVINGEVEIETNTFKNCKFLQSVTLENAKVIGDSAFEGCSRLSEVNLGKAATIGTKAFAGCSELETVNLSDKLVAIGDEAFASCNALENIVIPDSVETIGKGIFKDCDSLTNIKIPFLGENVKDNKTISYLLSVDSELYYSSSLKSISLTKISSIAPRCFYHCDMLETVVVPANINAIGSEAFSGYKSLKNFEIPQTVNYLGDRAYYNCSLLGSANIPNGVINIGKETFANCYSLASVDFPSSLQSIGENAFKDCGKLNKIDVPDSVTNIGRRAFSGCSNITSIHLPFLGADENTPDRLSYLLGTTSVKLKSVSISRGAEIASNAFRNYTSLQSVNLPFNLTSVGDAAFYGCSSLNSLDIPQGVNYLGNFVFAECYSLKELTLPEGLTSIPENSFQNCSSLEWISLPSSITSIGAYAFDGCKTLSATPWQEKNSIRSIGMFAFNNCQALASVTVPENVTYINSNTFANCTSLSGVSMSKNVAIVDERAFRNCTSLKKINVSPELEFLGNEAFGGCYSLVSIALPTTVTSVGDAVFSGCNSLESIEIPFLQGNLATWFTYESNNQAIPDALKQVKVLGGSSIPAGAFENCYNVTDIQLPASIKTVGDFAFNNCTSILNVEIPSGVKRIGERAFNNCQALTQLELPDTVTYIGANILCDCNAIEEIKVPFIGASLGSPAPLSYLFTGYEYNTTGSLKKVSLTKMRDVPDGMFKFWDSIEEIDLGTKVRTIGNEAFYNCRRLNSITLPNTLTDIGNNAFGECYKLYEVYNYSSLDISNENTFNTRLTEYVLNIYNDGGSSERVESQGCEFLLGLDGKWYLTDAEPNDSTLDFPKSFECNEGIVDSYAIAPYAFYENYNIKTVNISSGVTDVGRCAFRNCGLSTVSIDPESKLQKIRYGAFMFNNIKSIVIPETVELIEYDAFWDCQDLMEVYNFSDLDIVVESGDHGYVSYYAYIVHDSLDDEPLKDVTVNGLKYKNSGDVWILVGCESNVTKVVVDEFTYNGTLVSDIKVARRAFADNNRITSVVMGEAVTSFGNEVFANCQSLTSVDLKGADISKINESTFSGCIKLTSIVLPEALTEIYGNAFSGCTELLTIDIPDTVTYIGYSAFYGCSSLESIDLSNTGVEYLEWGLFNSCTSLTNVTLPSRVYTIGGEVFANCKSLATIVLPKTLNYIEYNAFYNCASLLEIYNLSTIPLTIGSEEYGCVALYAIVVHNSLNSTPIKFHSVNTDKVAYSFAGYNGNWYLYLIGDVAPNVDIVKLPELNIDGKSYKYSICGAGVSGDFWQIVIPDDVELIRNNSLRDLEGKTVYFEGTEQEWQSVTNGASDYNATVRYYSNCCHGDFSWTYDKNGNIVTEPSLEDILESSDSTCEKNGYVKYRCTVCQNERIETLPLADHTLDVDGMCTMCGETFVTVNNIHNYPISNSAKYPFLFDENGLITSTNHDDYSSAELTITADRDMTVTFDYYVTSEEYCDVFRIYVKNDLVEEASGYTERKTFSISLKKGDVLRLSYNKDSGVNAYEDCVYISNLNIK